MEKPVQRVLFRGLRVRVGIHTGTPEQIVVGLLALLKLLSRFCTSRHVDALDNSPCMLLAFIFVQSGFE